MAGDGNKRYSCQSLVRVFGISGRYSALRKPVPEAKKKKKKKRKFYSHRTKKGSPLVFLLARADSKAHSQACGGRGITY